MKSEIEAADAMLFVTPGHNRSVITGQPEAYIQLKPGIIDESYRVTNESPRQFLQSFLDAFGLWIDQSRAHLRR